MNERQRRNKEGRRQFERKLIAAGLPIPGKSPAHEIQRFRIINHLLWNAGMQNGWPSGSADSNY